MTLRTTIVSTYLGLAVVGVVAVSAFSSWQIKNYLDLLWSSHLQEHVELVASLVEEGRLAADTLGRQDESLNGVARTLGFRLTLIRHDGVVIYDSEVPRDSPIHLENHLYRPEVQRAMTGITGKDMRTSHSTGRRYAYAARLLHGSHLGILDSGFVRGALREEDASSLDAEVQAIIWVIGGLTIIVIAATSTRLAGRITRPILGIATTARAIMAGDLHRRADVNRKDEIGALARSINEMAGKLQADIDRLKRLERIRSEFLANVSHELRTPIFSIQGFLETLLDGALEDPTVNKDFVEKALRHASRLNGLLNDLIDIARIESGEMKMSLRYFPVKEFLQQLVEEFHTQAEKKNLRLTLVTDLGPEDQVYGDRDRLRQVMVNLIDNAIKYTDNGGAITVSAVPDDGHCRIAVADTGLGIAPEHLPRLFERFYRVDRDRSRAAGGTGLGLAIVKHIIEAHEGVMNVESEVGKGSTFSFRLTR